MYKTSRLVRISLLISAMTKSFAFFLGKVDLQKQQKTSSLYLHSLIKTLDGLGEFSTVIQTRDVFISGYANTENDFYCLYSPLGEYPTPGSQSFS